ncbi:MAG: diguanylate cyclase [Bryobacteraceae bacterium]|nr:diguanylate cyclase [Bryobacteraceae bacterium]
MKLLVVENDLDDLFLLQEALSEMSEGHYWRTWMRDFQPVFTDRLDDSLRLLQEDTFDAILLNLALPDSTGLHTFLRLRAESPATPIVVLANAEDEALAVSAVREGAQDYLIKSELDCAPLARALRGAIERHRMCESLRRLAFVDPLTNCYNLTGFLALCEHDLAISGRLQKPALLLLLEISAIEFAGRGESCQRLNRQQRDVALLEAAEILRSVFGNAAAIGRLGGDRFGVVLIDSQQPQDVLATLEESVSSHNQNFTRRCRLRLNAGIAHLTPKRYRSLDELLECAEAALCENKRGASPLLERPASAFAN